MKKSTIFYSVAILATWLVKSSLPAMDVVAVEQSNEVELVDRLVQSTSPHTLNIYTSTFDCLSIHNTFENDIE